MATVVAGKVERSRWTRSPVLAARYAWAVVGWNVLVILWGALVRATGSGAGCGNHWPLCNGEVIPLAPRVDTVIEFTHRCMTGGAAFAVLGLLVWTFQATRPPTTDAPLERRGSIARWAAALSAVLLLNEAFLGALLVKLGYVTTNRSLGRVVVLSVHLSNTLLLLSVLTVTAVALGRDVRWQQLREHSTEVAWAGLGLLATLMVGVSGSLAALGDTLFPSTSLRAAFAQDLSHAAPLLLRVRWVHPASAVLAATFVLWLAVVAGRRGLGRLVRLLSALLALQFVLGIADVLLLAPVWLQLLHLAGADIFWITLVASSLQTLARPSGLPHSAS